MDPEVRLHVPSIKVISRHTRSIVPNDDSVDVDHGHDFEYDSFSQLLRLVRIPE